MSEEEKKAIEYLKKHIIPYAEGGTYQFLINEVILNLINKQQEEIESNKQIIDELNFRYNIEHSKNLSKKELIEQQQEEIDKYKRYFKLAISDLQSEGYMQMPFKNIENYYSKREDIV